MINPSYVVEVMTKAAELLKAIDDDEYVDLGYELEEILGEWAEGQPIQSTNVYNTNFAYPTTTITGQSTSYVSHPVTWTSWNGTTGVIGGNNG